MATATEISLNQECEAAYERLENMHDHGKEVSTLLLRAPNTLVQLIVGQSKTRITCHRALLGFYSDFFEKACFGPFSEGSSDTMLLPEDKPEDIHAFVTWCYTGTVSDSDMIKVDFRLWILGDKLLAPAFMNAVAFRLCENLNFEHDSLSPECALYVYQNVRRESNAHLFMKALVRVQGPFSSRFPDDKEGWERVLRQEDAIDIVVDHIGYSGDNQMKPWNIPMDWIETFQVKCPTYWKQGSLENDKPVDPPNPCKREHPTASELVKPPPAKRQC